MISNLAARWCLGALAMATAGAARADLVSVLQPTAIASATSIAFQDSNVVPGLVGASAFNFVDQWRFTLDASFDVSAIAASLAFTEAGNPSAAMGVTNLQIDMVGLSSGTTSPLSGTTVTLLPDGVVDSVATLPAMVLSAGNYALEVRGTVDQPGSYSGSLLARPVEVVPLPPAGPLLLAGLAPLLFWNRRRG